MLLFNLIGLGALGIIGFLQACGIPVVLYLMDNIFVMVDRNSPGFARYESIFGQPSFENTTRIIAMSRNVVSEINGITGVWRFRTSCMSPAGRKYTANTTADPKCREENTKTRFVVCSRIAPHKGTELIVDAAEELVRRGETRFMIDVFGAGQVSPFLQRVQSKGLSGHIRYLGRKEKSELLALFAEYDALLFPTWEREAFGFTVPEAAGAGCFPIMTAGIGATEWFVDQLDCNKIGRTPRLSELLEAMYRTMYASIPLNRHAPSRRAAARTARRYMTFDRWLKVIEGVCESARVQRDEHAIARSRSVEAAFLLLSELWREGG